MLQSRLLFSVLVVGSLVVIPSRAADPPQFMNPLRGFVRSPFTAEAEVYSGAITGDSIGAAFHSATRGDYGVRFTFGFLKALNFNLNYMYSNQSRTFTAVTPPTGTLPTGTALLRAANLNMFFGNGELNLVRGKNATFYLSPGVGLVRNGSRNLTLVTPLGAVSSGVFPGTAVTFNIGAGIKIFPVKRLGFRIDLRDHISGGGTGDLDPSQDLTISGTTVTNPQQYFGNIPVQNNLTFTVGLIFKFL